jgi:hypothetical protein
LKMVWTEGLVWHTVDAVATAAPLW